MSISTERLKQAAGRFMPNEPAVALAPPVAEPIYTSEEPRSSGNWKIITVIVLLLMAGFYWVRSARNQDALAAARINIFHQVMVESSSYRVNRLFGGISGLRITVTNNADYLVDIVKVKVSYIKADGDIYKEELLYFNGLNGHSTQTLVAPESDRGTSVRISRESISCTALQLN